MAQETPRRRTHKKPNEQDEQLPPPPDLQCSHSFASRLTRAPTHSRLGRSLLPVAHLVVILKNISHLVLPPGTGHADATRGIVLARVTAHVYGRGRWAHHGVARARARVRGFALSTRHAAGRRVRAVGPSGTGLGERRGENFGKKTKRIVELES